LVEKVYARMYSRLKIGGPMLQAAMIIFSLRTPLQCLESRKTANGPPTWREPIPAAPYISAGGLGWVRGAGGRYMGLLMRRRDVLSHTSKIVS
jgi:hypothetical protein